MNKKKLLKYLVASLASIALFVIVLFAEKSSSAVKEKQLLKALTDAFTIPGIIYLLGYALVKITSYGVFDIFGYSIKLLVYNTFKRNYKETNLESSYRQYRENKSLKKRENINYLLVIGTIYFIGMIVCLIMFYI